MLITHVFDPGDAATTSMIIWTIIHSQSFFPLNSLGLLYESLGRAGVIVAVVSLLGVVQAPMVVRLEVHLEQEELKTWILKGNMCSSSNLLGSRLQLQPLLHQLAHLEGVVKIESSRFCKRR